MLVLISDLHLNDAAFHGALPAAALRLFRERLRDLAYDASWRRGNAYRPVEEVHVVLLGDVFDLLRSEAWLSQPADVRPWSDRSLLPPVLDRALDSIFAANREPLEVLATFASEQVMTLPPATASGRPARVSRDPAARSRLPFRVRIHYVAGNHDWFLHLPGAEFEALRRRVAAALPLATTAEQPFPHAPSECPILGELCERHRTWFRHGDCFDKLNFEGDRDRSSLGDAVVVDLLVRFATAVERDPALPRECVEGLRQIDYVRPVYLAPVWVNAVVERTCMQQRDAKRVKEIWNTLAEQFAALDFVRERDRRGTLALALRLSKGVSFANLSKLASWYVAPGARRSHDDARARTLVYGHTHAHEIVALEPGRTLLNTGTWRVVHDRTLAARPGFAAQWVMTYVAVYQDDERGGRPYEAWSGALALPEDGSAAQTERG